MRKILSFSMMLIMAYLFAFGVVEVLTNPNDMPLRGMCPYEDPDDIVLSNGEFRFTVDGSGDDVGTLKSAVLTSIGYDAIGTMKFTMNNKLMKFNDHSIRDGKIIFFGDVEGRNAKLVYSLNGKDLNVSIIVDSKRNENLNLRILLKICDLFPVILRDNRRGMVFIQGRNVAYLIRMEGSKSIYTAKGLMILSKRKADSKRTKFSLMFRVGLDIEELREDFEGDVDVQKYRVLDEKGVGVKKLRMSIGKNGKILTVSTTDDEGILRFKLPVGNYEFSPYQVEGYRVEKVDPKNKKIILQSVEGEFLWRPYITSLSTNSAYLNFKYSKPATASLILMEDGKIVGRMEDALFDNFHSIKLVNLKPNTEYRVQVRIDGKRAMCEFRTLDSTEFKFVVYGDTRTNDEWHRMVAERIAQEEPAFVINVGDLVDSGDYEGCWDRFFDAVAELTSKVPYFPVLGNHERNATLYYFIFMNPRGGGDFERRWYSFNAGEVHFVILDSNVPRGTPLMEEQTRWLIEDLEKNRDKKFKLVFFHHPFYTNTPNDEPTLEDEWRGIFERYHVNAVFNGHIHDYERFFRNGIHYVVTGGGGAPLGFGLYSKKRRHLPWSKREMAGFLHYILAEVGKDKIKFVVKSVGLYMKVKDILIPWERIIDEFTVYPSEMSEMSHTCEKELHAEILGSFK